MHKKKIKGVGSTACTLTDKNNSMKGIGEEYVI